MTQNYSPSPIRCEFFREFLKIEPLYNEHPTSKQNAEIDSLISGDFALVAVF